MNVSLLQVILSMLAGILVIIFLTTRSKLPAFFAMLIACLITGLGIQLSLPELIAISKTGFGNTMQSLGFLIVLGTLLGLLLEHTGSTKVMAEYILKRAGEKNASLALGITGFIVGLPVFCDSGFIVLSGLNKSMIKRTGISAVTMSVSLASGLYVVHCLLPPHPGAAAAAGAIGADIGKIILFGIIIAFPVMLVGHGWAAYAGKKITHSAFDDEEIIVENKVYPSVQQSFLPVIVPIVLIAARSFFITTPHASQPWMKNLLALGDPVIALLIAVLLALTAQKGWQKGSISKLMHEALEKAGTILLITGAGGAFGAILASTNMGNHFASMPWLSSIGLFFPFLLAFLLKTAQGSSTVAIITAASIVLPLLPVLGLDSENGKLLCALAMGAGSMIVSHPNDSYFWVIAKFGGIDMKAMLKVYSVATIIMGLTAILLIWILSLVIMS
ncbi:GntP family permease [Terrimonas pollutisoli]|uniref:GntP family permease n=1 Tax=Terrimonas pollutisoli TaxID=3034147 RepID=UPI0023EB1263|nr:GntP family permease [Terrimonas sp. H1YJ31]